MPPTAPAQPTFDFLFGSLPEKRELLHVGEVARYFGWDRQTIYNMKDSGDLEFHQRKQGGGIHITKRSVMAHVAKTAQYDPADLLPTVVAVARKLSLADRQALIKALCA